MVNNLVLVHHKKEIAEANAEDLRHSLMFTNRHINIKAGDIKETKNSDIVVITAAKPWRDNFKDRLDAAYANTELFAELIPQIAKVSPNAKLIIISNPVDTLTYHAIKLSGFKPSQVIGTGTLVDSSRFRALLAEDTKIHPVDLRANILGEHGDSQFPVFSSAQSGGEQIDNNLHRQKMSKQAAQIGIDIYKTKGNTNFVVSTAAMYIIESVLHDGHHTMPVSVYLDDFYGVSDICLSVPAVIGKDGVSRVLTGHLNEEEINKLHHSANIVKDTINKTKHIYKFVY